MQIPVISRALAAEELGVSVSTLRRMELRGDLTPARSISERSRTKYYDRQTFWDEIQKGRERSVKDSSDARHPSVP
tara:strand:- start:84 stop:311 length:228 start_codon:yes stop_codon:yes gene_type:complete